jgi:hypothetical protein
MSYRIDYDEEGGFVTIENHRRMSFHDWVIKLTKAARLAREKNSSLFFSDCRDIPIDIKSIELLDLPELYHQTGFLKSDKIAIWVKEEEYLKIDAIFYETICTQRGWMVKMFIEKETAIRWLIGDR